MDEKIYLTRDGIAQLRNQIKKLKAELNMINTEKSEAYSGAIGDGWHDNFAYEDAKRQEDILFNQINNLIIQSNRVEIVEDSDFCQELVNIGDVIELEFLDKAGCSDIDVFKLTGNWKSNIGDDYQEITLNSPLGKAIYKKEINSIIEYDVNGSKFEVKILGRIDNNQKNK